MAELEMIEDSLGRVRPQYEKVDGSGFEGLKGRNGHVNFRSDDGEIAALGSTSDSIEASTVLGLLRKLTTLVPVSLTNEGNLKTAIQAPLPAGANILGKIIIEDPVKLASQELTILPSETRTETGASSEFNVESLNSLTLYLNVAETTDNLDVIVETKDPVSGEWFELVSFLDIIEPVKRLETIVGIGHIVRASYIINNTATFSLGAIAK